MLSNISENRLRICYACPLYSSRQGGTCNNKLWLNPITGDVSTEQKDGYKKGCGCVIKYKINNPNSICPLNKW